MPVAGFRFAICDMHESRYTFHTFGCVQANYAQYIQENWTKAILTQTQLREMASMCQSRTIYEWFTIAMDFNLVQNSKPTDVMDHGQVLHALL